MADPAPWRDEAPAAAVPLDAEGDPPNPLPTVVFELVEPPYDRSAHHTAPPYRFRLATSPSLPPATAPPATAPHAEDEALAHPPPPLVDFGSSLEGGEGAPPFRMRDFRMPSLTIPAVRRGTPRVPRRHGAAGLSGVTLGGAGPSRSELLDYLAPQCSPPPRAAAPSRRTLFKYALSAVSAEAVVQLPARDTVMRLGGSPGGTRSPRKAFAAVESPRQRLLRLQRSGAPRGAPPPPLAAHALLQAHGGRAAVPKHPPARPGSSPSRLGRGVRLRQPALSCGADEASYAALFSLPSRARTPVGACCSSARQGAPRSTSACAAGGSRTRPASASVKPRERTPQCDEARGWVHSWSRACTAQHASLLPAAHPGAELLAISGSNANCSAIPLEGRAAVAVSPVCARRPLSNSRSDVGLCAEVQSPVVIPGIHAPNPPLAHNPTVKSQH
ncbi:hypothetical protein AB1Y20_016906 [Prymnesium parvum]|uniref:Uncharacterized protein n=1 Tax=Prymnesium parvum TaxID=97485 RepID=A0AB34IDQ2_PRYPA